MKRKLDNPVHCKFVIRDSLLNGVDDHKYVFIDIYIYMYIQLLHNQILTYIGAVFTLHTLIIRVMTVQLFIPKLSGPKNAEKR